jgi:hypothetical protein
MKSIVSRIEDFADAIDAMARSALYMNGKIELSMARQWDHLVKRLFI